MKKEEIHGISAGVVGSAENYADNVVFHAERGHGFAGEKANHDQTLMTSNSHKGGKDYFALLRRAIR